MRKLEKSERRRSERNSFLACSFSTARVVRSGEANAYFLPRSTAAQGGTDINLLHISGSSGEGISTVIVFVVVVILLSLGGVHFCENVFVDEVLNNAVCLRLVSEGNAACDDLLMGCRISVHVDMHVPVWCVHRNGRERVTQHIRVFFE